MLPYHNVSILFALPRVYSSSYKDYKYRTLQLDSDSGDAVVNLQMQQL
jgi:hypothetical protein